MIKERRRFLGVDQKSLGELSGVAVHTLSDIESGKGNPTVVVLCRITRVLGMDLVVKVLDES
ncbi:MAG: helix-turn-helix transcriptional regulator [Kiritimatiellae bacterium]|nr:helix-turn-helix transcriptional regulator [Kiritimatiellia bacterium]